MIENVQKRVACLRLSKTGIETTAWQLKIAITYLYELS